MPRTVDEYLDRITSWHRGRPKFAKTVEGNVAFPAALTNFIETLPYHFDLDVSIGKQEDIVGEWVGRSRHISFPLPDAWFSFDDKRRGFDVGVWKNESNSYVQNALQELDDETYRRLLYAKILANNWDGTTIGATRAYQKFFADLGSRVLVSDGQNMVMTVGVAGHVPENVYLALLDNSYIPLKPSGVRFDPRIVTVEGYSLFGFDVNNEYIQGFDQGAWGAKPGWIVRNGAISPEGFSQGWAIDTFGDDLKVWISLDDFDFYSFDAGEMTSVSNRVNGLPMIMRGEQAYDGYAIVFDGVDDELEIWSVPIDSESYSCFASAALDPVGSGSAAKLAILQDPNLSSSTNNLTSVSLLGRDAATKALRTDRNGSSLSSTVDLIDDVVSQLGVVYDAGQPTLYINGLAIGPAAWTEAGEIGRTRFLVGTNSAGGERWKGRLRELIVLNRVPTEEELAVIKLNLGKA
jgi:hypothetical protein